VRLPLADLLIGVTALELGYSVTTGNLRHFQMIPGLSVVQFWSRKSAITLQSLNVNYRVLPCPYSTVRAL